MASPSDNRSEDFSRFAKLFVALSEYYHRDVSALMLDLYWHPLKHYPIGEIQRAIGQHLRDTEAGVYFPKVADFIRILDGGSKDNAALAWTKLEEAIKHVGTYADIVFDDPIIHAVIRDMGGWVSFGEVILDKWPFVGNDFRARYAAYRSRGLPGQYPASLRGRANGDNWSSGYALSPPTLFGDESSCVQVICGGERAQEVFELLGLDNPALAYDGGMIKHIRQDVVNSGGGSCGPV